MKKSIGIIGAGPAGLTAAYLLAKAGEHVTVFESDPKYVGGISRTESYKGFLFDIGGHRFFSKSKEVEDFWSEILPNDMLVCARSSRIFYKGKFFSYHAIETDNTNTKWISATKGIYSFDNNKWTKYDSKEIGIDGAYKIINNPKTEEVFFCSSKGLIIYQNGKRQLIPTVFGYSST